MILLEWENSQQAVEWEDSFVTIAQNCIERTLQTEDFDFDAEVNLLFVDNAKIREINNTTRGIDKATDVLSFPLLEQDEDGSLIIYDEDFADGRVLLGDIVLSLERASKQAREYEHSLEREVGFLVVHSVLHLLGYDHERGQEEEQEMFAKQESILNDLNLNR